MDAVSVTVLLISDDSGFRKASESASVTPSTVGPSDSLMSVMPLETMRCQNGVPMFFDLLVGPCSSLSLRRNSLKRASSYSVMTDLRYSERHDTALSSACADFESALHEEMGNQIIFIEVTMSTQAYTLYIYIHDGFFHALASFLHEVFALPVGHGVEVSDGVDGAHTRHRTLRLVAWHARTVKQGRNIAQIIGFTRSLAGIAACSCSGGFRGCAFHARLRLQLRVQLAICWDNIALLRWALENRP